MAPTPFRRKAGKTARNLALAEAALALAKSRNQASSKRGGKGKLLLAGGALVAVGAAALLKRDKVAGLLPSRSGEETYPPAPAPPQPSNYDAPGPVANTATPIPAPDPVTGPAPIDEAAEEAAAAAEAASIGGEPSDYAGQDLGEPADESFRPVAEAGGGEAEGQEQAEAELAANATYRDAGMTDAERQIEEAIEQAGQPAVGETPEPLPPTEPGPAEAETRPAEQQSFLPPTPTDAGAGEAQPGSPGTSGGAGSESGSGAAESGSGATPEPPAGATGWGSHEAEPAAPSAPATETPTGPEPSGPATGGEAGSEPAGDEPPTSSPATGSERTEPGATPQDERGEQQSSGDDDWRTWSGRAVNP